uniref:Tubulin/FtsZ 2-layer sandwich domain-containing protein n=1 Tax=Octopus bimaculoides TaxID=37653 RepID=A0A0L8GHE3_OCTBM
MPVGIFFCKEHGIATDGRLERPTGISDTSDAFFEVLVNEIRVEKYKKVFHSDRIINTHDDASCNYARSNYTVGKGIIEEVCNEIRLLTDKCSSLQSLLIFYSLDGGTKNSSCSFMFDNEVHYGLCKKHLIVGYPTLKSLNVLPAQVGSSVTTSLRFAGSLHMDLNDLPTNLAPYPQLHFPLFTYAPIISVEKAYNEELNVFQQTKWCFETGNQIIKCNSHRGKYMGCLLYRGNVASSDVNAAIAALKREKSIRFVDLKLRAFVHWYVNEGMEESKCEEAREDLAAL